MASTETAMRTLYLCVNVRRSLMNSCGRRYNPRKAAGELTRLVRENRTRLATDVTIAKSRCLGCCFSGPVLLVHPEGVFYRYQTPRDLDEIVTEHLVGGRLVERLRVTADAADVQE